MEAGPGEKHAGSESAWEAERAGLLSRETPQPYAAGSVGKVRSVSPTGHSDRIDLTAQTVAKRPITENRQTWKKTKMFHSRVSRDRFALFSSNLSHPLRQPQPLLESPTQFSGTHCLRLFPECDDVALLGLRMVAVFISGYKSPFKHESSCPVRSRPCDLHNKAAYSPFKYIHGIYPTQTACTWLSLT